VPVVDRFGLPSMITVPRKGSRVGEPPRHPLGSADVLSVATDQKPIRHRDADAGAVTLDKGSGSVRNFYRAGKQEAA
jgi:hypothetical protein